MIKNEVIKWIDEIPWHEMDIDGQLKLRCEDPDAQEMETYFRRILFRWKYFQADMVIPPYYPILKSFHSTGNGIQIDENVATVDNNNPIVSHQYHDELETEADLEKLQDPVITADPEEDARRVALCEEVLDGIFPVKTKGHMIYYAPWDDIAMLRGVEPIFMDMMDRPEFLHAIISRFTEIELSTLEQMERLNLLESELDSLHCTPGYTYELPQPDNDGVHTRLKDVWFRGMAQMFSEVSPAMRKEFDLDYMSKLMARCGLVYYGCCEPLDRVIPMLKEIPNMRKIGVSPWANKERCAEQIGGDYVFAGKPNPALVASDFDEAAVRQEIEQMVTLCRRYGCPCELVLKDISTVAYRPQNLIEWNRVTQEVIDQYYG